MTEQKVKALLAQLQDTATEHRTAQRLFRNLAAIAQNSTSAEEAGRLIAQHNEPTDDIDEWTDLHGQLIEAVLKVWHEAARQFVKNQGEKK